MLEKQCRCLTIGEWLNRPYQFNSVQLLSRVWLFVTPWITARQASLSIISSWSLLRLMSIELVMLSNHLILCHPLLLLPSIFRSIRVFSSESVLCIRWPKYWSFSFSIIPSNECSGLISFRIDRLYILAVPRDSQESSPTTQFKSSKRKSQSRGKWLLSCEGPQLQLMEGPIFSMVNMIAFWGNYLESNKKYVFKKGFWGNLSHETMCWIMATVLHMPVGHSKF